MCAVTFDWEVHTTRAWMNALAPLARPVFHSSHDRLMRRGGRDLAAPDGRAAAGRGDRVGGPMGRLDELDLSLKLSRKEQAERLEAGPRAAAGAAPGSWAASSAAASSGPPVCVLFEGWDASGKGGAIKRLVAPLDPRHVRVAQFAAPTPTRSATTSCGGSGRAARLGRHGRARPLLVRAGAGGAGGGLRHPGAVASAPTTRSSQFERSLALEGMILIKFWMHISEEEQLRGSSAARRSRSSAGS